MRTSKDKSYIISEDIFTILNGKGYPQDHYSKKGIVLPSKTSVDRIRKYFYRNLRKIFPNIHIYSESQMNNAMSKLVQNSPLPIIALDRIHTPDDPKITHFLDLTRSYCKDTKTCTLTTRDPPHLSLQEAITPIAQELKKKGIQEIALLDDVIFGGGTIKEIAHTFKEEGIQVSSFLGVICTKDGKEKLHSHGSVSCAFEIDNFHDQICERDFYFGISHSGTLQKNQDDSYEKKPYFLPFGDPVSRASIPKDKQLAFSITCLRCSLMLWQKIEKLSGKKILIEDLPEKIYRCSSKKSRVIDVIKKELISLTRKKKKSLLCTKAKERA